MRLTHRDYRAASLLRLKEADELYEKHLWVGATYLYGRAAEAILRSLIVLKEDPQESGHDLAKHLAQVRSAGRLKAKEDGQLHGAVNEVATVWQNNLRFAGDKAFLDLLKAKKRDRRIGSLRVKGDPAKANAKSVREASETIVHTGEAAWLRWQR